MPGKRSRLAEQGVSIGQRDCGGAGIAVFDATDVCVWQQPLTVQMVLAALKSFGDSAHAIV
jgi:hypothetical protein